VEREKNIGFDGKNIVLPACGKIRKPPFGRQEKNGILPEIVYGFFAGNGL
jgi:hypothetical protein